MAITVVHSLIIRPPIVPLVIVEIAFVTSVTAGTPRNDFTGRVGYWFTPSVNITVDTLGRWVLSGNSASHTISLYNSSPTLLASVSVNTSGATPNAFIYGSITPVHLTSGQGYFLESDETSGGDQFLDSDTSMTTTSVAVIGGHTINEGSDGTDTNHGYVVPGFQYH